MNFSPYQPPPDAPGSSGRSTPQPAPAPAPAPAKGKSKGKGKQWFSREGGGGSGYQAGGASGSASGSGTGLAVGEPAAATAFGNDPEAALYESNAHSYDYPGSGGSAEERANAWETRFGWRLDVMAAAAYLGGPITALLFLIIETQNDYVRFHAYQSALLTGPLVAFMLLTNLLIPLWGWLRTLIILAGVGATLYAAYRAYTDAQDGLGRFWLPYIGEQAERWVNDE